MSEAYPIESLELLEECQARAELDLDAVEDYAEAYRSGAELPPIDIFLVGDRRIVVDGFHRAAAAVQAGADFLRANVAGKGTLDQAGWHASGVNKSHGVRRTPADKRRAVRLALDGHGADQSNRVIAEHVGVSHELVRKVRAEWEVENEVETPSHREGADGKRYPIRGAAGGNVATSDDDRTDDEDEGGHHAGASGESSDPPPAGGTGTPEGGSPDEEPPSSPQGEEPWTAERMPGDAADLEELAGAIRANRLDVRKRLEAEGPRTSLRQRVEEHLERAEQALRLAVPMVCPTCAGDGCDRCNGRGWTTRSAGK